MLWIGGGSLLAAGVVGLRWWFVRTDALGRIRSFPWISVVLLTLVGCAALTPWVLRVRLEHRLSDAVSFMLDTDADVNCQSFGGAFVDVGADLGYVAFDSNGVPERATLIKREQCGSLSDYVGSDKLAPSMEQVVAVHVLTHETIHMSGVTNEAETECLALQRDAEMARLLGAPQDAARALAVTYWRTVYPRMPADYRSEDCGPGLVLDLGSPDAPWTLAG